MLLKVLPSRLELAAGVVAALPPSSFPAFFHCLSSPSQNLDVETLRDLLLQMCRRVPDEQLALLVRLWMHSCFDSGPDVRLLDALLIRCDLQLSQLVAATLDTDNFHRLVPVLCAGGSDLILARAEELLCLVPFLEPHALPAYDLVRYAAPGVRWGPIPEHLREHPCATNAFLAILRSCVDGKLASKPFVRQVVEHCASVLSSLSMSQTFDEPAFRRAMVPFISLLVPHTKIQLLEEALQRPLTLRFGM